MTDVTRILSKIEAGDRRASAELLPLVYDDLRKLAAARMANERPDHTLQATALVHEAYLRLVDTEQVQGWDSRGHFFSAAAEAMRRILIESARRKKRIKRGGDQERCAFEIDLVQSLDVDPDYLLDINDRLEQLAAEDPQAAEFAKLRLFAGLTIKDAGKVLGWPSSTAHDHWAYVRAWFVRHMAASSN